MPAQQIEIVFHPEVRWEARVRNAWSGKLAGQRGASCLLPWICLAFAANRARRRPRGGLGRRN